VQQTWRSVPQGGLSTVLSTLRRQWESRNADVQPPDHRQLRSEAETPQATATDVGGLGNATRCLAAEFRTRTMCGSSTTISSPVLGICAEDEAAFAQRIASGRRRVECAHV
jgi:hypothetical protein